jgi:hypothetical protein
MDVADVDRVAWLEHGIREVLDSLEGGQCCGFFACPGPTHPPVHMASCAQSWATDDLRSLLGDGRAVCTANPCEACGRDIRCGKPVDWDNGCGVVSQEPCYLPAGHGGEHDA